MLRETALASTLLLVACSGKAAPRPAPSAEPSASGEVVLASAAVSAEVAPSASADAVSHASAPAAEGPGVLASGKVDGAALRAKHIERLRRDRSPVTVLKGESALDLGTRICEAVVPKRAPPTPILLKPNICGFDSIKDPDKFGGDDGIRGRGTDVEFTRGVVRCLKARGHKSVTIAEGCGHSHRLFLEATHQTGYDTMAKEEGVALVALDDDGVFDVVGDQPGKPLRVTGLEKTHAPTLLLPKILAETLDHGLFISLPKIKAHRFSVVSLAIKGMQGTVMLSDKAPAFKQKWRMHKELVEYLDKKKAGDEDRALYVASLLAFGERMVDVLELSMPDVVLADGAPAMAGDGFHVLRPSAEKIAVGGTNPVAVDKVGAQFLGLWNSDPLANELGGHRTSPLIEIAAKRYELDLDKVEVQGDGKDAVLSPRPVHFKAIAPFRIDFDPNGSTPPAAAPDWSALPRITPLEREDLPLGKAMPETEPEKADAGTAPSAAKPEAHAARLPQDAKLTMDGVADEPSWGKATPVVFATDYAGKPTPIETKVRLLWSSSALYAFFELAYAGFHTDTSKPIAVEREGLFKEDCVELFLVPDRAHPKRYYEIELGPFGHFFDLAVDREAKRDDIAWSSRATIGTSRDTLAHTATIEVEIAAPEIKKLLVEGASLPLGIYRMEGIGDRQYLAWSPPRTPKPNFHVPEAFGWLVLDK